MTGSATDEIMPELAELRRAASEASGGTSDEAVYDTVLGVLGAAGARGDVLDFGAGTGCLTRRLAQAGRFDLVAAADLMTRPEGLPREIRWYSHDLNEPLDLPAESFDAIVACEIVEHLENPRALAREWFRLLRPGGLVVVSTPNNESVRSLVSLVVRGHYVAFSDGCYPAHITALVRKDIERLLSEAGFADIGFSYTGRGGIPGAPSTTWQAISAGLLRGLRWSDGLVASARKRPTSGSDAFPRSVQQRRTRVATSGDGD